MATMPFSGKSVLTASHCPQCSEDEPTPPVGSRSLSRSRQDLIAALREELGPSEESEHLIDWLLDMWETIDLLIARFGAARAWQIIAAPAVLRPQPISSEELAAHLRGEESALADLTATYP
ncbi:hypothetical protein [Thermogemmatispora sp.]|uniref:hypothetical protein n=1 Tax=Thermogemmatispora sp. TaxID=1968838 RepID=UPI001DB6705A|nr:hypothetical protein [Thermogemmatispora sp.]MBX5449473.1 hypothetical protein [Thermogemmatispora sp.]